MSIIWTLLPMSLDGLPPDCRVYRVSDPFVESLDLAGAGFGKSCFGFF
jgi:hypothetical protein